MQLFSKANIAEIERYNNILRLSDVLYYQVARGGLKYSLIRVEERSLPH